MTIGISNRTCKRIDGPKSIAGPARYDKWMQKTSVKVGKSVGEGWSSPQACSMIAGATLQQGAAEFRLLSCRFRRCPARAAKGKGTADPPGSRGRWRQPKKTAARAESEPPACTQFPKPGTPASLAFFPRSEHRHNFGAFAVRGVSHHSFFPCHCTAVTPN